ncbi:MAG: DEAD/DEAH box helicase [Deltaproteobacteria bacterium]|nr:DEAD/DEAH box helicase [Deltaproteobacteria bacterium]
MTGSTLTHESPIRLTYQLEFTGKAQTILVKASLNIASDRLTESELKRMIKRLHPIDQTIAHELFSSSIFGQISDTQLARILPLLAHRETLFDSEPLKIEDRELTPRIEVTTSLANGLRIAMYFQDRRGERINLEGNRLLAGAQAFLMANGKLNPITSGAPWDLTAWSRQPIHEYKNALGPAQRDELVHSLSRIGVPPGDLQSLAVRRAPPDRIVASLYPFEQKGSIETELVLHAQYAGDLAPITTASHREIYMMAQEGQDCGLIERDLEAEHVAREQARHAGFRYDANRGRFIARGEAALRALDIQSGALPASWTITISGSAPRFHHNLQLNNRVELIADRGLLELNVDLKFGEQDDDTQLQTLIDMQDLLKWLAKDTKYIRLADGSFIAPNEKIRRGLRVLGELGADSNRILVSPLCIGLIRLLGESGTLAAVDANTKAWMDEVMGHSAPRQVEPPLQLTKILRDYQHRGLDWLMMLHRYCLTGILADDMGLGKTLQALALLQLVRDNTGPMPSLVVAPTSVLPVWSDEALRFTPNLKVLIWHGSPEERRDLSLKNSDLVVTSYGVLRRDIERFAECSFRYVILDEAQSAKNAATQNAKAVRRLKSERRLALTGTPIENRPEELWSAFDFLAPGFLGSLHSFRKRFARPIERGEDHALIMLSARVQPFVLRRLKSEVAKELPPKIESIVHCEMLPAQRALYDHMAGELRTSVKQKIASVGIERAHMSILAALTRLRQICCEPALLPVPEGIKTPESAKLSLFTELMREALESSRRVVVFSQFVEMQKRLIAVIRKLGVEPLWLHGGTRDRARVVSAFQDPAGPPVIVVSLKAGGTGVTLTRADTVMHYDPWWNPAVERQATDRTHRLGQKQKVTVYKLVTTNSIEERVVKMAGRKDDLAAKLLSSDGVNAKHITVDEILHLLD